MAGMVIWLYFEAVPKYESFGERDLIRQGLIDSDTSFMIGLLKASYWMFGAGAMAIWFVPDSWFRW